MLSAKIRKAFAVISIRGSAPDEDRRASGMDGFMLDVDLKFQPGVTVLFGASGSGKTLTLKSIAGLIQPNAGAIKIGETTLFDSERRVNLPIRARGAGYVFQHLALFPHLDALANVEFPMTHMPRAERRESAFDLLKKFRVEHTARRLPRHISGGEAQRVALARALASRPRFLLLDEPLSALDETIKLEIIRDLRNTNRELRLPIVYVTHSRDEALALGERAYVFERGRVVAAGEPADVFGSPAQASVARLTGVENIFAGVVLSKDAEGGTMVVEIGGDAERSCRIETPLGQYQVGERITIAARSGDILLATTRPDRISARNILAGTIIELEERGEQTLARVQSGVTWRASVTRRSVKELDLAVGKDVWLAFKTYSCRIFDNE
jgi:molybdate transport system ATP-binding protein